MALKLPTFDRSVKLIEEDKTSSYVFHRWWQAVVQALESAFNTLESTVFAIQAVQDAANTAQAAADSAQASATAAASAASTAQTTATDVGTFAMLNGSGVVGATITASDTGLDAQVVITSHTRIYGDGSSVSVTGTTISGLAYSTLYFIYYDQASYAGGTVSYQVTTSEATAAQVNDRHLVGSVVTPASLDPDVTGKYVKPAGLGSLV